MRYGKKQNSRRYDGVILGGNHGVILGGNHEKWSNSRK